MVTPSIVPLNSNGSQWVIKQGHILTPHLFKCYSQNPNDQTPIKKKKRRMIWFLQYWHISLCWALERHLLKTTKKNNKNPFFIFTKNTYEITKMTNSSSSSHAMNWIVIIQNDKHSPSESRSPMIYITRHQTKPYEPPKSYLYSFLKIPIKPKWTICWKKKCHSHLEIQTNKLK